MIFSKVNFNSEKSKLIILIAFCIPFVVSYLIYFNKKCKLKRNNIYVNGIVGERGGSVKSNYQKYSITYNSRVYHGTYTLHGAKFGDTITVALDTLSGFNRPLFLLYNNKDSIEKYKNEFNY